MGLRMPFAPIHAGPFDADEGEQTVDQAVVGLENERPEQTAQDARDDVGGKDDDLIDRIALALLVEPERI